MKNLLATMFFSRADIVCNKNENYEFMHRRRIKIEAKAYFVSSVWGTECIQFLAVLAILYQDDFEELDEFILFFKSSWCNSSPS